MEADRKRKAEETVQIEAERDAVHAHLKTLSTQQITSLETEALGNAKAAGKYDTQGLQLLVALCCELQQAAGQDPFFLACRTAGNLLGVSHMQANRWLFLLDHDGIIELVEKGEQSKRRASRYRYVGG